MNCKDCMCCEVCDSKIYHDSDLDINKGEDREIDDYCCDFKDRNLFLELPCKVGETVYIKGVPLTVSFIHMEKELHFAIQFACGDCEDCLFYVDEVSWEGEHDCRTQGYIEFTEEDIGKTVFLTRQKAEKALQERTGKL